MTEKKQSFLRTVVRTETCYLNGEKQIPKQRLIVYIGRQHSGRRMPFPEGVRAMRRDSLECGHALMTFSNWGVPSKCKRKFCKECKYLAKEAEEKKGN